MTTPFEHLSSDFWATAERFIGTKEIDGIQMTRGEYADIRGWNVPKQESRDDDGYIVRYVDGHVSWSPENTFESCYVMNGKLNFGHALHFLKEGGHLARIGWNGADQFIFLVPGSTFNVNRAPLLGIFEEGTEIEYHAHIDIKTVQGTIVPWLASQTDMLANDWVILD